jgi:hypothetical protein
MIRSVCLVLASLVLASCTHNNFMPNVIQLSPNGTQANPASESLTQPFTLTAVEDGYTGQFTADVIKGSCWVVQTPVTSGGAWTVVPQGSTCGTGAANESQVTDQKGNAATTFVK